MFNVLCHIVATVLFESDIRLVYHKVDLTVNNYNFDKKARKYGKITNTTSRLLILTTILNSIRTTSVKDHDSLED